jgi:hypothetical protein
MKRILVTIIGFGFFATTFAQDAFDKKMQFGIVFGTGFNINKTSTLLDRKGIGFDNTLGLNVNYNLNPTLTLTSGVEFDFESYKYTPRNSVFYFYTDNNIIRKKDFDVSNDQQLYMLSERQYQVNYFTIPLFLTLKTKAFGNMQYFGKFGSRIGMRVGGRINDLGHNVTFSSSDSSTMEKTEFKNTNMTLQNDIRFIKLNAGVSGGAMWNFSGTTMLVAELGYFFGLSQIHQAERLTGDDKKRDYTLIDGGINKHQADWKYSVPQAKQGQVLLKLTLFF